MEARAHRVARSQPDFSVSRVPLWSRSTAGPRALASPGSSSPELHLSCRVLPRPTCSTLARGAPSLGFSFPIATPARAVHLRMSVPCSPYVPPSTFLTSSTACSSSSLAGLFRPAATSGILLSGVRSRCPAASPRRRSFPSWRSALSPAVESPRPHQMLRPASRVSFRAAIRDHRQGD